MKQSRISRVVQILGALQSGEGYTAHDLSRMFGTSRRTIFRDLKELQAVGVPYRCDAKTGRYAIEPDRSVPPVDLNIQEALSLLVLACKVSDQIQVPFKESALMAALKIESHLPENIRQFCSSGLRNISTGAAGQASVQQNARFDRIFAQLFEAIAKKCAVEIRYDSLLEGEVLNVELCPYHLLYRNRTWHVLGLSSLHNGIRTFELACIKDVKATGKCFPGDEDFDVAEYLSGAWSAAPEGQIYHVRLRFLPKVAGSVAEVTWHSTQKVIFDDDGSAIIEFRVDGLSEITWWVLSYGDQVQVLEPQALRTRVLAVAKNMVKLNENG